MISAALRPLRTAVAAMYSPLELVMVCSWEILTPALRAKASAAAVGFPSLNATLVAGPVSCSSRSG
jgi:hypothetical protein